MPLIMTMKAAACSIVTISSYNLMAVTGTCINFDPLPILLVRFVQLKVLLCKTDKTDVIVWQQSIS
jgi:hypothetical protein